jgi:hypothetical protein
VPRRVVTLTLEGVQLDATDCPRCGHPWPLHDDPVMPCRGVKAGPGYADTCDCLEPIPDNNRPPTRTETMAQMTAQHEQALKAVGVPDAEVQRLRGLNLNIDWGKLIAGIIAAIMSSLNQQPAPTPGPTPIAPAQQTP